MNMIPFFLAMVLPIGTACTGRGQPTPQSSGDSYSMVETAGPAAVSIRCPGHRQTSTAIPWNEIGATAEADYKGDGLSITPTETGARLQCVFQRLEGEATSEGLWLTSTIPNSMKDRFRVRAAEVGRVTTGAPPGGAGFPASRLLSSQSARTDEGARGVTRLSTLLPAIGNVSVADRTTRFTRPGLVEEYSVSMDGIRQDFLITQRPEGTGELLVRLDVAGLRVEQVGSGAELVLARSGRKIAYSRLRVSDANCKELPARMEFVTENRPQGRAPMLGLVVNDADAVYPVRIDPTFSDDNWISLGGVLGANGLVYAAVVDGSGNLYIGGEFTVVGQTFATNIAKWNGSNWSALGSGIESSGAYYGTVAALAVSGSDLYAAGHFSAAGGDSAANNIAKWNGSNWSVLGSGIGGVNYTYVSALAVSGGDLYAGGYFTSAGDTAAKNIAKWNGSSWSALGSGMGGADPYGSPVVALVVLGSDLYAGGYFTTAGGTSANHIAKWNGISWSVLGSGTDNNVYALAVSGSELYAGGGFTNAGGTAATNIAKWNGSSWLPLGSGMGGSGAYGDAVSALAVSGTNLYAGGYFTTAGSSTANYIAKWNGSSWSALGSGMDDQVLALAVSGNDLYVGGNFTTAGGRIANYFAKWNGSNWSTLDSGLNGGVSALAVSGSNMYAGGNFTNAGGGAANYIAKWNGSTWSAVGSGMSGSVRALAVGK